MAATNGFHIQNREGDERKYGERAAAETGKRRKTKEKHIYKLKEDKRNDQKYVVCLLRFAIYSLRRWHQLCLRIYECWPAMEGAPQTSALQLTAEMHR